MPKNLTSERHRAYLPNPGWGSSVFFPGGTSTDDVVAVTIEAGLGGRGMRVARADLPTTGSLPDADFSIEAGCQELSTGWAEPRPSQQVIVGNRREERTCLCVP